MTTRIFSANFASFIFEFASDFLFWSFFFCICISSNESITYDFRFLYEQHQKNQINQKCVWFIQVKKIQEKYLVRKHELQMKNKIKQKAKKLLKQQKKTRLIKKRAKEFTCKRCKHSIKFDNNIKLHEHIRIRHAKKSKFVQQSVEHVISFSISFVSSSRSIIFSFFSSSSTSSKVLFFSMLASEIVRERSENVSSNFSSIATSKKSIFWAEIVSRSIVASKLFRFSIATFKSMCKFSKNANVVCSSISSRIFSSTSSRFYLIVNDLYRMFVEKSNSFDLQSRHNKSLFSRDFDKCNFANKCDRFIQSRITSYFHATISSVSKSIKFETFESTHVRERISRQFSISSSISFISFSFRFVFSMRFRFSTFSRSFSVCKHCQKRSVIYRFIDWVMSNVFKIESNEIFMRMRYWRFVFFHFVLKEYWLFCFEKVITLKKYACLFVVLLARFFYYSLIDLERLKVVVVLMNSIFRSFRSISIWRSFKICMLCLFCFTNVEMTYFRLYWWFRFDLTRLIIVSFFYYFWDFSRSINTRKKKRVQSLEWTRTIQSEIVLI